MMKLLARLLLILCLLSSNQSFAIVSNTATGVSATPASSSTFTGILGTNHGGTGSATAGGGLTNLTGSSILGSNWLTQTSANAWAAEAAYQATGTCNYYDYFVTHGLTKPTTAAAHTADEQSWLLDCELKALTFLPSVSTNAVAQRTYIRAIYPRGGGILNETNHIDSPLVIPEYVAFDSRDQVRRDETTSGALTAFWTGDDTAKALTNLQIPAVLVVPHAHIMGDLNIQAKSGSNGGAALYVGKIWIPAAVTLQTSGACGYTAGNILSMPQPSTTPYTIPKVTLDTVDGSGCPLTYHLSTAGAYALPPVLAQQQYNSAAYLALFTTGIANNNIGQVFDPAHTTWYITSGGSGSGAEFTISTWQQDFIAGTFGGDYYGGGALIADTIIERVSAQQCGTTNDATYKHTMCVGFGSLNYDIGSVTTTGGYYGIYLQGVADIHGGFFNPVDAVTGIKIASGGSIKFGFECDTPSLDCMEIDNNSTTTADGYCINVGSALTGLGTIVVGGDSAYSSVGHDVTNFELHMNTTNCGGPGVPALYADYMTGSNLIDIVDSNTGKNNAALAHPNTLFAQFGTHNISVGKITGAFDSISGNPFSGTVPNEGISVWDAALGGYVIGNGACSMTGSGTPTNAVTGLNVCGIGSYYTDVTNGRQYIGTATAASPVWVLPTVVTTQNRTWQISGTLAVANDLDNWIVMPAAGNWTKFYSNCKTGPVGAAAIFDIQKSTNNGAAFTSIWNITPASKITVADGAVAGNTTSFDTSSFNAGDVFRIDVDQVGSGTAGNNCTITGVASY